MYQLAANTWSPYTVKITAQPVFLTSFSLSQESDIHIFLFNFKLICFYYLHPKLAELQHNYNSQLFQCKYR